MERADFYDMAFLASCIGGENDFLRAIFYALVSERYDDLDEVIEVINQHGAFPDDFLTDISALQGYRQYYGKRMGDYTLEQRHMLKAFDGYWTEDLVRRMMGLSEASIDNALPAPEVQ